MPLRSLEDHSPVVTLAAKDVEDLSRLRVGRVVVRVHRWERRGRGLDPFEDRAGRLAFQVGPVLAAGGVVGVGEALACERCLVRGADLVPESYRLGQGLFCVGRIAVGEPHPSSSKRGAGDQRFALESSGYELQLVGGRSGPGDVPDRDLDLDLCLE
jgi:hypothetical protein